jgi:integrase
MACIRKRRGKWVIDWRDGSKKKRVRHWATFDRRDEADAKFSEITSKQKSAVHPNANILVKDCAEKFLKQCETTTKPRTVDSYRDNFRLYILPKFGDEKLCSLNRGQIKSFLVELQETGLSKNTVRIAYSTIRALLYWAIDDGIIKSNEASRLGKTLHLSVSPKQRSEEIKAMDRNQVSAFLTAAFAKMSFNIYALFLLLARSGLRFGESIALAWEHLDFNNRTIRVERAFSKDRFETPKNGCGRDVDMSQKLCSVLQELKALRKKEWFKAGQGELPSDSLVFLSKAGTMLDYANVLKMFKKCLKIASLPLHYSPHCMRHTFASILLQDGVSPAYVQAQLGHASIQLTVDTYGKWLPKGNRGIVDKLDDSEENTDLLNMSAEKIAKKVSVSKIGSKLVANGHIEEDESLQVIDSNGEPCRNRTYNLLIKSQLLCQLS